MMTKEDIHRLIGDKTKVEKLISNAVETCKNAQTDWAKNYWFGVWKKLCEKYGREDLYRKDLH